MQRAAQHVTDPEAEPSPGEGKHRAQEGAVWLIRLGALVASVGFAACFTDEELEGQPCVDDEDCEVRLGSRNELSCKRGFCTSSVCGNGKVEATEDCDDQNTDPNDECVECRAAECGDGILWMGEEECDDANDVDGDDCLHTCQPNRCGDGIVNPRLEQCDDGNSDEDDGCTSTCTMSPG